MFDFRPILFVVGVLLTTLALAMCIPAAADAAVGQRDWQVFLVSAGLTLFVGAALILTARTEQMRFSIHQAFLLTTVSWLVLTTFAALPFAFAGLDLSYTDAFFEAMSGLTTTGSTVIVGLDLAPPGILLWRALLQWLGGIGIIVMAVAVMPMLQVGGNQLFRMESSDRSEKVLPRVAQIATGISVIYLVLTLICATAYWLMDMTGFEAIAHAMTTIATGGFSTSDGSLGRFGPGAQWIATVFMVLGGLPFVLYLQTVRGNLTALLRDTQVRVFLTIVTLVVIMMTGWLLFGVGRHLEEAIRLAAFNVVSIITGTGYATAEYDTWGGFAMAVFFLLMFIGGCAGSTTCGIKIFRFQVGYATARAQIQRLVQPHGVFIPHYNRKPLPAGVPESVMSFIFMYVMTFIVLAVALGALGLDFVSAVSGAATAVSNVGPALGETIGPARTFMALPDTAKWLLSAGMLLGRLELFTVLVLLLPSFWRR